jgi:hypothetical protein
MRVQDDFFLAPHPQNQPMGAYHKGLFSQKKAYCPERLNEMEFSTTLLLAADMARRRHVELEITYLLAIEGASGKSKIV